MRRVCLGKHRAWAPTLHHRFGDADQARVVTLFLVGKRFHLPRELCERIALNMRTQAIFCLWCLPIRAVETQPDMPKPMGCPEPNDKMEDCEVGKESNREFESKK